MRTQSVVLFACGFFAAVSIAAAQTNHYVWKANPGTPSAPYTNWATAARDIQSAIEASAPGAVIWVTNGVYDAGGVANFPAGATLTNRVAIHKAVIVQSVNGPEVTSIKGAWDSSDPVNGRGPAAVRCVYMGSGATLIGFTLTNGATLASGAYTVLWGGGVYLDIPSAGVKPVISNCVMAGNSAVRGGGSALGRDSGSYTQGGRFYNCRYIGNFASGGGGAGGDWYAHSEYHDCVFSNNYASSSVGGADGYTGVNTIFSNCVFACNTSGGNFGGVNAGTHYNSVIYGNSAGSFYVSGGSSGGVHYNSEIYNNWARQGGGANGGTFYGSRIYGNTASFTGGGLRGATAYDCDIYDNASQYGCGADGGTLHRCALWGNYYLSGGQVGRATRDSTLYFCTVFGHAGANEYHAALWNATAYNSLIVGNFYGARSTVLYNCTVVGNNNGARLGTVYNSIVYHNAVNHDNSPAFTNSCTTPEVSGWAEGNIVNTPMLVDSGTGYGTAHVCGDYRLTRESPCVDAGMYFNWLDDPGDPHGRNLDLDGNPRIRHHGVDMGAYELRIKRGTTFSVE